jgi:hypothetical protein
VVLFQKNPDLLRTVLIYHSVKKSFEHMFWCSNTSSDSAVGAYSHQSHEGMANDDLSANYNDFMHYVL